MNSSMKNDRGFVIITCLSILLMLGIIGAAAVMKSADDVEISGTQLKDVHALYAAEAGAEYAYGIFRNSIDSTNFPPDPLPTGSFDLDNFAVDYTTTLYDSTQQVSMNKGTYRGLYGLADQYDIVSTANSAATPVRNTISLRMEKVLVPVFQFAVFYDPDLEFHPGPFMTLEGRVHSNGNIYLGSGNGLDITSYLTASNTVLHGRKPGSGMSTGNGAVRVKDKNGVFQDMDNGDGTWLDNTQSDWVDESLARWGGQVQDMDHGINELYLPVAVSGDPIDIIHDASGSNPDSYERKAGLKIIDGQAYFRQADDSWTNVTAVLAADSVISTTLFYDSREGKNIASLDIDISQLNSSPYWPTNGLIYTKQTVTGIDQPATRLVNGSQLKSGLTVVSENPMYTLGDYNSVNKKPAAVISDAYTILSNLWDDTKSTQALATRVASDTRLNLSLIAGNTTTGESGHTYNGGLENLPRFMEEWTGKTITIRGSMVDLWESEQATGMRTYGLYYTAPDRDWGFDNDLLDPNKLPPGTPMVNIVVKKQWAQIDNPDE